ncbi:hypothetical protein LR48_Vigan07g189300 [Vigna angularis]|uniref:Uncharacterized protein n=1 Tax=Phaseolus angularis TaxID=3914 RepID=A0A0L9V087_PHAAN|nr:hypothetical protein LR48_Vigan07g189300 [Vigna angularis]
MVGVELEEGDGARAGKKEWQAFNGGPQRSTFLANEESGKRRKASQEWNLEAIEGNIEANELGSDVGDFPREVVVFQEEVGEVVKLLTEEEI